MDSISTPSEDWAAQVAKKQVKVKSKIPSEWTLPADVLETQSPIRVFELDRVHKDTFLSESDLEITENHDATQLLKMIADGILTSLEVTVAFCKRAAVAHQLTSCLTEIFFDEAQERARFLDSYYEKEKKTIGPLHGLPISLKDSFNIKGIESTLGYVSFLDRSAPTEESALVKILLNLGAVLYVKTNIPQTLMTADSHNNVFGRTLNPHNVKLTAGGSSGGEGALIAMRGSLLGVGTDIAGSIRIPSLCCGTYGFKPSPNRVPYGGQTSPDRRGFPCIDVTAGPLATSLSDINLFMSSIMQIKPWQYDSTAQAIHWRSLPSLPDNKSLIIGVLAEDPLFPLHPPVKRALETATAALKASGHKIVHLPYEKSMSADTGNTIASQYFMMDPAGVSIKNIIASGEPMVPSVSETIRVISGHVKHVPLDDIADLNVLRAKYKEAWHKIFNSEGLDVVIAPGAQNTAVPHDTYGMPPYTAMWNVLDYPACIIPYSRVSKEIDPPFTISAPAFGVDFDPELYDGAPCAIQVVAPHLYDEECLQAATAIDEVLRRSKSL